MRKFEHEQLTNKRNRMIENLVDAGVFKINEKQLYELSLYELTKNYMMLQKDHRKTM